MDSQKVDMFLMTNGKMFSDAFKMQLRERLLATDDSRWAIISSASFKDSTTTLILSILLGSLGVDRFYIGDIGMGIGKLLTCGGCGIWTIVDWFLIMNAARKKNDALISTLI